MTVDHDTRTRWINAKPTDLVAPHLTPDRCYILDDEHEWGIQANRPRAAAISNYARAHGYRVREVTCRRRYLRLLTRQESWECHELEKAESDWIDNHEPPLTLNANFDWVTPDGTVCELPATLGIVPSDWEPNDDDPVWEFCKKSDAGAIPCWELWA